MRALLSVVLVVKDEEKTIAKTLESVKPFIDRWTVLDTGSTDGTKDVVKATMFGGEGHVFDEPFVDYATSRNRAIDFDANLDGLGEANPTAFSLTLSADETLVGGEELRAFLEAHRDAPENAYCVMMRSGPRQWPFPRVLRTGGGWRYVNTAGARHEQPVGPKGEIEGPLIPGVYVVHEESDPKRKHARLRERDLPDLTKVVEDETKPLAERAEAIFQLAETHFVLGFTEKQETGTERGGRWLSHLFSAMALYTRYAEIADTKDSPVYDLQKSMYARLQFLYVGETFGLFEPTEMVKRLTMIAHVAPQLPEAHWLLAKNAAYVDVRKALPLAMRAAKVARHVYENPVHGPVDTTLEWQALRLAAECAKAIKDKKLMRAFAKQALEAGAPREMIGDMVGPS